MLRRSFCRMHFSSSSFRCKSFCLGIFLTSLTWAVVLYLYIGLGNGNESKTNTYRNTKTPFDVSPSKSNHLIVSSSKNFDTNSLTDYESNNIDLIPNEIDKSLDKSIIKYKKKKKVPYEIRTSARHLDDLGLVKSPEDQRLREDGYRKYAFNILVSNRLSYHRQIPDIRNALCKNLKYEAKLPAASVVICFYNEATSALLRTIHSVLDRTPSELLHEVVLVDDCTDTVGLIDDLKLHLKNLTSKVVLYRTEKREGLIRARTFGARRAKGQVLVFLDSHCEVNRQWLEPLLTRISDNRTNVVCPIIDIINTDTFAYSASPLVRGGFNWGLHFKWDSIPHNTFVNKKDYVKPIMSPTMAGGLFAIDREYFVELGEYDQGMDIWGGENLEISFRIWMCGGRLEIVPCSRVGHVFRKHRPYGSPSGEDTMLRNSLRVAHVWMDEYKDYYFQTRPDAINHKYGNITDRIELRKKLQCKSFDWYLKNVYPELKPPIPNESRLRMKEIASRDVSKFPIWKKKVQKTLGHYQIRLSGTNFCLESEEDVTTKGSLLLIRKCRKIKSQAWFETEKHELLLAELLCLDAGEKFPRLSKCHEMGGPQEWKYTSKVSAALYNLAAGQCLGVRNKLEGEFAVLEICTRSGPTSWDFIDWNQEKDDKIVSVSLRKK